MITPYVPLVLRENLKKVGNPPHTKKCRERICVGTTWPSRPKVPTFGCRADMSPTCRRHVGNVPARLCLTSFRHCRSHRHCRHCRSGPSRHRRCGCHGFRHRCRRRRRLHCLRHDLRFCPFLNAPLPLPLPLLPSAPPPLPSLPPLGTSFLPPCCCRLLVDWCVPPLLPLFPPLLPALTLLLLAADIIGDGGNCDNHFLAKDAVAVATAAREIFLRGDVQNISLVKVIF